MMLTLMLERYNVAYLREMGEALGVEKERLARGPKARLIAEIAEAIVDALRRGATTADLSEAHWEIVSLLLEYGGSLDLWELIGYLYHRGLICPLTSACPHRPECQPVEALLRPLFLRGIIVVSNFYAVPRNIGGFEGLESLPILVRYTLRLAVASELIALLEEKRRPLPPLSLAPWMQERPPAAPAVRKPYALFRDALLLWLEIRRRPPRFTRAGRIALRELRQLSERLRLDEERIVELTAFLIAWDAAGVEEKRLVAYDLLPVFWRRPLGAMVEMALAAFRDDNPLYDAHLEAVLEEAGIVSEQERDRFYPPLLLRRRFLQELAYAQPGLWIELPSFLCLLSRGWRGGYVLDIEMLEDTFPLGGFVDSPLLPTEARMAERALVEHFLEQLWLMGLVALAFDEQGALRGLSTTPLFAALMAGRVPELPTGGWQLTLQPDAQIVVIGEPPLELLIQLGTLAELESRQGPTLTYRLTRESIYFAFRQGETPERIRAFFEEKGRNAMPQNIARMLEAWWSEYRRIRLRPHRLIVRSRSPALIDALLRDRQIAAAARRPRDDLLVLPERLGRRVEKRLEAQGWPPREEDEPPEARRGSLRLEGDRLLPLEGTPSLYVEGLLPLFAERDAEGWRLTPASVAAAAAIGLDAVRLVEVLEPMLVHPLPEEWKERFRLWGHYYGTVTVTEALLLRFPDRERLADLLRLRPSLRRSLRPVSAGGEALAIVKKQDWAKVEAVLREAGVTFEIE